MSSKPNREENTRYDDVTIKCGLPQCGGPVRVKVPADAGDIVVVCIECGHREVYPQFKQGTELMGEKDL